MLLQLHGKFSALDENMIDHYSQSSMKQGKMLESSVTSSQIVALRLNQMTQLLESLTKSIPKDLRYRWEGGMSSWDIPIRFSDAIGRNMYIPLIFCSSTQVRTSHGSGNRFRAARITFCDLTGFS
jgi:hypothetical protein